MLSNSLQRLIYTIAKLPGLGSRSARRIVLYFLQNPETAASLSSVLDEVKNHQQQCRCGNIDLAAPCNICSDSGRDAQVVCVVETVADLWAMERSGTFKGLYHVLGGVISTDMSPDKLTLTSLLERVKENKLKEVILAISATLNGQTTCYYIADLLSAEAVQISRLAFGIPMGAELEYMDDGTLGIAMQLRQKL